MSSSRLMRRSIVGPGLLVVSLVCVACGTDDAERTDGGGCNARIEYPGVTYRPHNELNPSPPVDPSELGDADVLGCAGDGGRDVVGRVAVHQIEGVDPALAIAVEGDWLGVYAAEDTDPEDWPAPLRAETR